MKLQNKIVVVTGASEGIGLAISRGFAERGARVAMLARNREKLEKAVRRFSSEPLTISCDVSDPQQVTQARNLILERFGTIDILVNNAGFNRFKPIWDTSYEDWQAILNTNLTGTFLVTRAFLPALMKKKSGHIVNIVSVAGVTAFTNCSAYCSSKFGQLGFSRVIRQELMSYNIRVTAILPGATATPLWDKAGGAADQNLMMAPERVAEAVFYACEADEQAAVEEIVLRPAAGDL